MNTKDRRQFTDNECDQVRPWREVLPIHPAANLFPCTSNDDLKTLGEDIKMNKLTSSIVLWRESPKAQAQLLDGRSRLDAIELVTGCPADVREISIIAGEFEAFNKVTVLD